MVLTVILPDTAVKLAVKTGDIQTAYRLYVNGEELLSAGIPGSTGEASVPYYLPAVAAVPSGTKTLRIVMHISNYDHRHGGVWESLYLGKEGAIRGNYRKAIVKELILFSSIMFMGLYHLCLQFINRKKRERGFFYFGLFCVIIAIRTLVTGECLGYSVFSSLPWGILHRLEYLTMFLSLPVFLFYLKSAFPDEYSEKVLKGAITVSGLFVLFTIFTPSAVYTFSAPLYQVVLVLGGLYIIFKLFRSIKTNKTGSIIILAGFFLFFLTILNDILHSNLIWHSGFLLPIGFFLFLFSQSIFLSLQFARTYDLVEKQKQQLEEKNDSLLLEVAKRIKLEENLIESHDKFAQSRFGIILGLAKLAEYRDENTGSHLERMSEYSKILAEKNV